MGEDGTPPYAETPDFLSALQDARSLKKVLVVLVGDSGKGVRHSPDERHVVAFPRKRQPRRFVE